MAHRLTNEGEGAVAEAAARPAGRGAKAAPSLLYLVKRTELAVRARLDEVLKPSGLTALQYTALTVLERHDGLTAAQLARDSFVTAQSMADMVRTLESRGYVVRHPNPANRRELLIALTDLGHRLLADYERPVRDIERRMTDGLTDDDAARLRRTLDHAWQPALLTRAGPRLSAEASSTGRCGRRPRSGAGRRPRPRRAATAFAPPRRPRPRVRDRGVPGPRR